MSDFNQKKTKAKTQEQTEAVRPAAKGFKGTKPTVQEVAKLSL